MEDYMKKFLKYAGIVFLVLIILTGAMVVFATFGLEQTLNLDIRPVDLSQISDGTYTGSYDSYRWSTTVEVTVKDHKITDIKPVKIQQGREDMVKDLTQKILAEQKPDVDAISGATASSKAFLEAVDSALLNAQ
jgi:uncharacterized protein with FMN-binding domain